MKLLALDSAFAAVSAAVWIDGKIVASNHQALTTGHAEALLPLISRTLDQAGVKALEITRIGATIGPGHFTGLRAGLAAAQGLATAIGADYAGIDCFAVVASALAKPEPGEHLLIAFDSKRDEAFVKIDDETPYAATPEGFAPPGDAFLVGGDRAAEFVAALTKAGKRARRAEGPALPRADLLAPLAAHATASAKLVPLYIHPPAITQAKPR